MVKRRAFAGKLLMVGVLVLLGLGLTKTTRVSADSLDTANTNVTIQANCYAADSTAQWTVTNPDSQPTTINWMTLSATGDNPTLKQGSYVAPSGTSTMTTYYGGQTLSVIFSGDAVSDDDSSLSVPTEACTPVTPVTTQPSQPNDCIDGSIRGNLVTQWYSNTSVKIHTLYYAPLCNDVTIYLSSYLLPDNYNGNGFGDPTSYPQNIFDSTSVVLKAGSDGFGPLEVTLPDACKNSQVDVYYAPEVTIVGRSGHGDQYISGFIIPKSADCTPVTPPNNPPADTPPATPVGGKGGGPVDTTPPAPVATPATAATPAAPAAATLSDTGINNQMISIFAATLIAAAVAVASRKVSTRK